VLCIYVIDPEEYQQSLIGMNRISFYM